MSAGHDQRALQIEGEFLLDVYRPPLGNGAAQGGFKLKLFEAGKLKEARELQMTLIDSNNAVTARWGIPGLKAAMDMIGLYGGDPRPPLMPLAEANHEELRKILAKTGFLPKR